MTQRIIVGLITGLIFGGISTHAHAASPAVAQLMSACSAEIERDISPTNAGKYSEREGRAYRLGLWENQARLTLQEGRGSWQRIIAEYKGSADTGKVAMVCLAENLLGTPRSPAKLAPPPAP